MLGQSSNPIVFNDYESFIKRFTENPKTTDECWTPNDVYEAVLTYVRSIHDMTDKVVLRPFFPNGDYENADYPSNGVVIDNPPFSIFLKVIKFYTDRDIPFFLFGPGLTIGNACKYCTAVIIGEQMVFTNGAKIRVNFATNLLGDTLIATSAKLTKLLSECPSQQGSSRSLPKHIYPQNLLSISDFQTIAGGDDDFCLRRDEVYLTTKVAGRVLFGCHFITSTAQAKKAAQAKEAAQAKKAARAEKAARIRELNITFTADEQRIVDELNDN